MIHLQNVTYHYPRGSEPALADLTLDIPAGQFCAVVGANGAGKSTFCYALSGFVPHFYRGRLNGRLHVAGHDVAETPLAQMAGEVGLVFANPFNQISGARFTVREEIAFGLENLGVPRPEMIDRIDEVLAITDLSELAGRSPYALSGGQQQRVAIAAVIVMRPPALVLDEPTSQLDPTGTQALFALLRSLADRGTTVVMASHELEWIGTYADRVIALANGRLVADGAPRPVLSSMEMLDYGVGQTRYTELARAATEPGRPDQSLPVTLEQAVDYFA